MTKGQTILGLLAALSASLTALPASAQMRPMIYTETTVDATPADAFEDWTTSEGIEAFFAPEVTIDPVPGGQYKLCMIPEAENPGSCGNDEGVILAMQADKMLSFTWAMPPYMPEIRPHMTVVQMLFEPVGDDQTRVRLFHTGFGSGEAWQEGHTYFEKAWPAVLGLYKDHRAAEDDPSD